MKAWELIVSIAQVSLIMALTGGLLGIGIGAFAAAATWVYRVLT